MISKSRQSILSLSEQNALLFSHQKVNLHLQRGLISLNQCSLLKRKIISRKILQGALVKVSGAKPCHILSRQKTWSAGNLLSCRHWGCWLLQQQGKPFQREVWWCSPTVSFEIKETPLQYECDCLVFMISEVFHKEMCFKCKCW